MKRKLFLAISLFVLSVVFVFPAWTVFAQSSQPTAIDLLQKQIQSLLLQVQTLQNQVMSLQAELGAAPATVVTSTASNASTATSSEAATEEVIPIVEFKRSLAVGQSGEEVRRLQEFFVKDRIIYPEGLVTGYFGPATERAVKRWQEKHNIESVGRVGPKSIAKLNELIAKGAGPTGVIPPGLLIAPGIQKKLTPEAPSRATSTIFTIATSTIPFTTLYVTSTNFAATSTAYVYPPPTTPVSQTTTQFASSTTTASSTATSTVTAAPPIFTITSPNGGEQITVGNTYTVTWISAGTKVSTVNIDLYKLSGWSSPITYNASNTGSFSWTIPATLAAGSDYKIRVYNSAYYNNFDESNNTFTIIVPTSAPSAPPVGYWRFDGSGNNEIMGSPSAVAVNNAVFKPNGGKFGGYLYIPTGTDYAKIPYNSRFDLPDNFTIEFWFRQRSNQSFRQDLIYKGSRDYYPSGNVNFWIWRQLWNEYNFGPIQASFVNRNTGYYVGVTNSNQLSHNEWHHVVYTKDPSGSEYYLDGVSIYRNTDSAQAKTPAVDIIIGDTAVDTDFDNLRIYNYALSRGEVLYNWAETAPVSIPVNSIPQVQGLTATVSGTSVALSWQDATGTYSLSGSPSNMFGSYNIYRGSSADFTPSLTWPNDNHIAQGSVLSYTDSNLSAGTYYYKVALQDKNGVVGPASSAVSANVIAGPPVPTNVQAVTTSGSQQQPPEMWYYVTFKYTLQSTTQSFNVYRKRPTDTSFVKYTYNAQTSVNPSILPLPTSGESNLYHRDVNGWEWWTTLTGLAPDVAQGEYKFYVTAVDANNNESVPSETKSFKLYAPPVILSPAGGSTISSPFPVAVSGDQSAPSPTYGMALYKKTTGDTAWSVWPAPSTNFTYTGPALSPSDNPHRLVVWFTSGSYDRSLFGTSIFNVSTTTSSINSDISSRLAQILELLNNILSSLKSLR